MRPVRRFLGRARRALLWRVARLGRAADTRLKPKTEPTPAPKAAPKPKRIDKTKLSGYPFESRTARGEFERLGIPEDHWIVPALREGRYVLPSFTDDVGYTPPGPGVTFVVVCTDDYAPGLEALLLSILRVYPDFASPFIVLHDGNLSPLNQDRLVGIYPAVEFRQEDPAKYGMVELGDSGNHKRIGHLGYLTLEALALEEPEYVVILDADLLVLGDISVLWSSTRPRAVSDAGAFPFAVVSAVSGKPVLNSGVISLPRSERGPAAVARANEILLSLGDVTDDAIARFADQKFWNVFLWERDVEYLPHNYNANKALIHLYYKQELPNVRILHFTDRKPWFEWSRHLSTEARDRLRRTRASNEAVFALWDNIYIRELSQARHRRFEAEEGARLESLRGTAGGRPVALIGNGPSINQTDLSAFDGYEKVVFNWFPNFEGFDDLAPQHLVIASHMIFGRWHTPTPALPQEYLDMLASRSHRPRIWTSYYFKPYIESLPELEGYEKSYFLFEKPLKRMISRTGQPQLDLHRSLVDANTGVLTVGVPMALLFGADTIVLAGCDSNYASTSGSYFYRAEQHGSNTTRSSTLLNTWKEGGTGQYGYHVTKRELDARGIRLLDATIDGALQLPKISLDEARAISAVRP